MTIYARIEDDGSITLRDLDPALVAMWVETNNPKALQLRLYVVDAQPVPSATQVVIDAGVVVGPLEAHQTWGLRAKTADELEAEALAAEKEQVNAYLTEVNTQLDITNATYNAMTNAQKLDVLRDDRRVTLKVAKFLLRRAKADLR
jgi:hypothetical protein